MVERKYTDPVDGPNLDEHPELQAEEVEEEDEKPRRGRRRRVEPEAPVTAADAPVDSPDPEHGTWQPDSPPVPEKDWASGTARDVTFKPEESK